MMFIYIIYFYIIPLIIYSIKNTYYTSIYFIRTFSNYNYYLLIKHNFRLNKNVLYYITSIQDFINIIYIISQFSKNMK
ncbi:hypothetical protein PFMC_05877 [Plasmodium falciparum CAMP/Malaysia]|uniref:Uncharacterized protein n=1 Tax=Plasmodium falciparum (isolate Camp / Malaysia) TaxID=5835 RepID=A0A024WZU2_PLAFC|nr:hypothetical protein PFMC_05877 [Plasmodium falciparum CAMP/Malaysia]